ncbi:mitotic spindle checkpoint protein Bub3 [Savitreella phatthalungensis]
MSIDDLPGPSDSVSSLKFLPGSSTVLLASSWDCHVRVYDLSRSTHGAGSGAAGSSSGATMLCDDCLILDVETRAPVLDSCFLDESHLVTAGLDGSVRCFDVEGNTTFRYGAHHPHAARAVKYSAEHELLISGGWDGKLVFGRVQAQADSDDTTTPTQLLRPTTHAINLHGKVLALTLSRDKLVVAQAGRMIDIFSLAEMRKVCDGEMEVERLRPVQTRESSLKYQTRTVECTADGRGYICTSIEGRVSVEFFGDDEQERKYAFKCHRQQATSPDQEDIVHPVHAVAFHPIHHTFATAGGDGVVSMWDLTAKKRVKQYASCGKSLNCLAFAEDGRTLVMGVGGDDGREPAGGILVRPLGTNEGKGKSG